MHNETVWISDFCRAAGYPTPSAVPPNVRDNAAAADAMGLLPEPEAVAQAAETIQNEPGFPWLAAGEMAKFAALHPDPDNPDEPAFCRWCDRPAVILNSVCGKPACAFHEDDSSEPHAIPYAAIVRQRDRLREQRDELADALAIMRKEFGNTNLSHGQKIAVNMAESALRKAGRQ